MFIKVPTECRVKARVLESPTGFGHQKYYLAHELPQFVPVFTCSLAQIFLNMDIGLFQHSGLRVKLIYLACKLIATR